MYLDQEVYLDDEEKSILVVNWWLIWSFLIYIYFWKINFACIVVFRVESTYIRNIPSSFPYRDRFFNIEGEVFD